MPTKDYFCLGLNHSHDGNKLFSLCSKIFRDKLPHDVENYKWEAFRWKSFITVTDVSNYCLTNVRVHIDKYQYSERFTTAYYFI